MTHYAHVNVPNSERKKNTLNSKTLLFPGILDKAHNLDMWQNTTTTNSLRFIPKPGLPNGERLGLPQFPQSRNGCKVLTSVQGASSYCRNVPISTESV
jgi:hypothetical protein